MNPNNPLKNSTGLPLCKRGIEGDLAVLKFADIIKSPLGKP
jgi:hypothetical protein